MLILSHPYASLSHESVRNLTPVVQAPPQEDENFLVSLGHPRTCSTKRIVEMDGQALSSCNKRTWLHPCKRGGVISTSSPTVAAGWGLLTYASTPALERDILRLAYSM